MNRAQRRSIGAKRGEWIIELPLGSPFNIGERMTIPGVRVTNTGQIEQDCRPGDETRFVVASTSAPGSFRIIPPSNTR